MLVEQQVKLVKGRSGHLPMRLLVEIAQSHGVGQELIELLGHFQADGLFQLQRLHAGHGAKCLKFAGGLVEARLSGNSMRVVGAWFLSHESLLRLRSWASQNEE